MPKPLVSQNLNPRYGSIQLTFSLTMRGAHCEIPRKSQPVLLCSKGRHSNFICVRNGVSRGSVGLGVDWHPYAEAWAFPICTAG